MRGIMEIRVCNRSIDLTRYTPVWVDEVAHLKNHLCNRKGYGSFNIIDGYSLRSIC